MRLARGFGRKAPNRRALRGGTILTPWVFTSMAVEGHSISAGATYWTGPFAALRGWTNAVDGDPFNVYAVSGSGMSDAETRLATLTAVNHSLILLYMDANDLHQAASTQAYFDRQMAYRDSVKAAINPDPLFGLALGLPQGEAASGNTGFNARLRELIVLQRAALAAGAIDFLVPFGAHPDFSSTGATLDNPALFDGAQLHPSNNGNRMRDVAEAAFAPAIAGALTGTTPADFTVADVNNATASTDYTVQIGPITGLGFGKRATASIVSGTGQIKRGNEAYGTSSFEFVNGDYITLKVASSAANATARSLTVDIGGRQKTFTVTTAAASVSPLSVEALAVNFGGRSPNNAGGSSTQTWSNMALKKGLMVLQIESWNNGGTIRNCTQVAITPSGGGTTTTSTTELVARSGKFQAMGIMVPADGNYTVTFTFAANLYSLVINAAVIKGDTITVTPTQTQTKALAANNSPYSAWSAQNCPANGAILFLTGLGSVASSNTAVTGATDLVKTTHTDTSAGSDNMTTEIAYSLSTVPSPQISHTPASAPPLQGFALSFSP